MKRLLVKLLKGDDIVSALSIFLLLLVLFFSVTTPHFLSVVNFTSIIGNIPVIAVLSLGLTFVILIGGLDLSVGAILGVTAVIVVFFSQYLGWPLWAVLIGSLAIGAFLGALNGTIITKLGINSIITTLAMMAFLRGLTYWFAIDFEGLKVARVKSEDLLNFARTYLPSETNLIPITLIYLIILYAGAMYVLKYTTLGRDIYAVGSNEHAARLAGINVHRIKFICYVIAGTLSAFGGVILVSQLGIGEANSGEGMELEVITAVVLGGIALSGGKGKLTGVIVAILILAIIRNGMVHLEQVTEISFYWREVAKGVILILAISLDAIRREIHKKQYRLRQ